MLSFEGKRVKLLIKKGYFLHLNCLELNWYSNTLKCKNESGQFSIETIHERRKRNREFSGVFFQTS